MSLSFHISLNPSAFRATPSNRIPALQEIKHFSELHTMQQRYWNSNKFTFLPSLRLSISILIFPQTVDYIQSKCLKMSLTIINVWHITKIYLIYPNLFFLPVRLPSEIQKLPPDPPVRGFPGVWKLLLLRLPSWTDLRL